MAPEPISDPRTAGNSRTIGSVADIDETQNFEEIDGEFDLTDQGENPGDSGGAANDGGDPQDNETIAEDEAPSAFGDNPTDAFDSEAPTG